MSRNINPFALRMPPELRAQVEASAKASGRSVNSEIVTRLQESFEGGRDGDQKGMIEIASEINEKLKILTDLWAARNQKQAG